MIYQVGPGSPYDEPPDEKYVTVKNLLLSIAVVVVVFILGVIVGSYLNATEIKEFSETTTTEEPLATTENTTTATETTTTETTTTTTSEETTTTTTSEETTTNTTVTTTTTKSSSNGLTSLGSFKGTYYSGKSVPCKGGSGRTLIDCSTGGNGVKGSVASKLVYQNYGYKRNGERTKVYLEIAEHPSMNGWYYVDDCNAVTSIIDFYFYYNKNCPFQKAGVVSVKAYIYERRRT